MVCLIVALGTLTAGVVYLATDYQVAVGWVQILLGLLSTSLVFIWKISERRDKKKATRNRDSIAQ